MSATYVFGPFTLNCDDQTLTRDGSKVSLTPKGYQVLCYLIERHGHLVPQAELIRRVWPGTYVQSDVLKSQIRDIRRALGEDAAVPRYIATRQRLGYIFIAEVEKKEHGLVPADPPPPPGATVGMAKYLGRLTGMFEQVKSGVRQVVFVTGETGSGKSTVVDELEHALRNEGQRFRVLRGHGVQRGGARESFYPVLEALSAVLRSPDRDAASRLLSQRAPTWYVQFPALLDHGIRDTLHHEILGSRLDRMLREMCEWLAAYAEEHPVLLILEDLHWADVHTLELVDAVANGRWPAKVMVIATLSLSEGGSNASAFQAVLQGLTLRSLAEEIQILPLTREELRAFLRMRTPGGDVSEDVVQFISEHTEGNPLFVIATLDHLRKHQEQSNSRGEGKSGLTVLREDDHVPGSLRQMLELRIDTLLSSSDRKLLSMASVCGLTFSTALLAGVTRMDEEQIDQRLHSLAQRRLFIRFTREVTYSGGETSTEYRFEHEYYRQSLYGQLGRARRAALHRGIGRRLEDLYSDDRQSAVSQMAWHFEQSGDWVRAVHNLISSAEAEEGRFAFREATKLLERGRMLLRQHPEGGMAGLDRQILDGLELCKALVDEA